jgi:hypothetical protein
LTLRRNRIALRLLSASSNNATRQSAPPKG